MAELENTALMAEVKAASGGERSDVREEGPILLSTNIVKGNEILPELKARLKELINEHVIR